MKYGTDKTLDRARFAVLLDAYGADPERWPEGERAAALALLRREPEAQALRARAARLDALLAVAAASQPSPALVARILAAAPAPAGATRRPLAFLRRPQAARAWRYAAAAVPVAAAAALTLWLVQTPTPNTQFSALALAQLGEYETPGDELLGIDDVDLVNADPWSDCPDAVLGCPDTELAEDDPLSGSAQGMGTYS